MSSSPELEDRPVSKKRKGNTPKPKKEKTAGGGGERSARAHIAETVDQLSGADRLMLAMKEEGKPMKDIVKAVSDLIGKPANKNTIASRIHRLRDNLKVWPDDHVAKLLQIKKAIEENLEKSKMVMIATELKVQTQADYSAEAVAKKLRQLDGKVKSAPITTLPASPQTPGTSQATTKKAAAPRKTSAKKFATPKLATRAPTPTLTNPDSSEDEEDVDEGGRAETDEHKGDKGGHEEINGDGDEEIEDEDAGIKAEYANDQSEGDEDMDGDIEDLLDRKGFEM